MFKNISYTVTLLALLAGLCFVESSFALMIWDQSPATLGAMPVHPFSTDSWSNIASGQNWADEFPSLSNDVYLTGIDIYSNSSFGFIGQSVTVRLWSYDKLLLDEIHTTISAIDTNGALGSMTRKHADIDPLLLLANNWYWIGMIGTNSQIAQAGLTTVYGGSMAQFNGTTFDHIAYNNEMAFRLEGTTNIVPEPSSFILFCAGIFGVGLFRMKIK